MPRANNYKANADLHEFGRKLKFVAAVFDNEGSKFRLKNSVTRGEIDAVLYGKNLLLITEVYSGSNDEEVNKKIASMKSQQANINSADNFGSSVSIDYLGSSTAEKKEVDKLIEDVHSHLKKINRTHTIHFRKLLFCPYIDIDEEREEKAMKDSIYLIDKEVFSYFNKIYKDLGEDYFFREVMSFWNITKVDLSRTNASSSNKPGQISPLKVARLVLERNKSITYSCVCHANTIEEYTTVYRPISKKYDTQGFQRALKEKRIEKIASGYLSNNETFPNNIIIALDPNIYKTESDFFSNGEIKLFDEYNSLLIIDGQHRFFSLLKTTPNEREALITFIFFQGEFSKNLIKMYEIFYEINRKQERVDPSLSFVLKAYINPLSEEAFWFSVLRKLNISTGFFKNRVSFKEKQLRYKDEKGIISVVTYGGMLSLNNPIKGVNGLSSIYAGTSSAKRKFAASVLNNFFGLIQLALIQKGMTKDDLTPREIGAFIRIIRHFMWRDSQKIQTLGKLVDFKKAKGKAKKDVDYIKKIISYIDFNEILGSNLSASNWAGVEGLILKQIRKKRSTFGNIDILSKKALDILNT